MPVVADSSDAIAELERRLHLAKSNLRHQKLEGVAVPAQDVVEELEKVTKEIAAMHARHKAKTNSADWWKGDSYGQ